MKKYNPNLHHRRSIQLKGYDYTQAGLYFITICMQNRICLFGEIIDGQLVLNDAGRMIEKWYRELENKFPDIKCHQMVVMPNHFHCIIENTGAVQAGTNACPNQNKHSNGDEPTSNSLETGELNILGEHNILSKHTGSPLHRVMQWFKTMSTNEYIRGVKNRNWRRFDGKLWQRDYWEHIIRNKKSYKDITNYIINNPSKWDDDWLSK